MKLKILCLLAIFSYSSALAGLPPTTTKAVGDSVPVTTFNFEFPNFSVTRTGVKTVFGLLGLAGGGTGYNASSNNDLFTHLSPLSAPGDLIYGSAIGTATVLHTGSNGGLLTQAGGLPAWLAPGTNGQQLLMVSGAPTWSATPTPAPTPGIGTTYQDSGTYSNTTKLEVPYAQLSTISTGEKLIETGNGNLMGNGSFEWTNGAGVPFWVLTNATFATETTNIKDYKQALKVTLSSTSGKFLENCFAPTVRMAGQNFELGMAAATTVSNVQVCASVNGSEIQCNSVPTTGTYSYTPIIYGGIPNSATVCVYAKTTSSQSGDVYVDAAYTGTPRNLLGAVSLDTPTASLAGFGASTSFGSVSPYSCLTSRVGDHLKGDCNFTSGTVSASQAYVTLPTGYVIDSNKVHANTQVGLSYGETSSLISQWANNGEYSVYVDGVNNSNLYFGYQLNGPPVFMNANSVVGNSKVFHFTFDIPIVGWSTALAQTMSTSTTPQSWSAYADLGGTTTATSGTYTDIGSTSGTVHSQSSSNMSCVAASGGLLGYTCTFNKTGIFQVCYSGFFYASNTNTLYARLVDGSGNIVIGNQLGYSSTANGQASYGGCGQYNVTSISSPITFKVQGAVFSSGTETVSLTQFSVLDISQAVNSPMNIGSITSNAQSPLRMESLGIGSNISTACTSSPCSTYQASSNWFTNVTRGSTGGYEINIPSGVFSSAPMCVASATYAGGQGVCVVLNQTTTDISIRGQNSTQTVGADLTCNVICIGPR